MHFKLYTFKGLLNEIKNIDFFYKELGHDVETTSSK